MKYTVTLATTIVIGAILLGYSITLEPFVDEESFWEQYDQLETGQSEKYFQLYSDSLTPKYRVQDTGLTLIAFSLLMMCFRKVGRGKVSSPAFKPVFFLWALLLPFITMAGFVFDLHQGVFRHEFPSWADSIAIPLIVTPFVLFFLLIWSLFHLFFLSGVKATSTPVRFAVSTQLHPWLAILSGLTFLMTILTAYYGQYWYSVPLALWLYYYLSLGAVKIAADQAAAMMPIGYIVYYPERPERPG